MYSKEQDESVRAHNLKQNKGCNYTSNVLCNSFKKLLPRVTLWEQIFSNLTNVGARASPPKDMDLRQCRVWDMTRKEAERRMVFCKKEVLNK